MDTGAISAHYEYDPFGRLVCKEGSYADENEYRFSTKRYCSKWGLYDYGYRHYSPDLGRWMSRDPIGEQDGPNIYCFNASASDGVDNLGLVVCETVYIYGIANNPQSGDTLMHGRIARKISTKTFSASVSPDGCFCTIDDIEYNLVVTIYAAKAGDVRDTYTDAMGLSTKSVKISPDFAEQVLIHERLHRLAFMSVGEVLLAKAEGQCRGAKWRKPTGKWTESECKREARKQVINAKDSILDNMDDANKSVHKYHLGSSTKQRVTVKIIENLRKELNKKLQGYLKEDYCQP